MAVIYTFPGIAGDIYIDFTEQIISCADTIVTLEIQELVDACRAAEYSESGVSFPKICNASGKEYLDINNGVQVGITIVLLGNWRVYTLRDAGVFKVTGGNLVQVSGGDPFEPNPAVTYINIQSAASTIVSVSSGSGLSAAEHTKLMGIPSETLTPEQNARLAAIQSAQAQQLTENRFVDLQFNRQNTIVGTGENKRISGYRAGEAGEGQIEVTVVYDEVGALKLPQSETVAP